MHVLVNGLQVVILYKEGIAVFLLSALGLGYGVKHFLKPPKPQPGWISLVETFILGSLLLTGMVYLLAVLGRVWFPLFTVGSRLIPFASIVFILLEIRKINSHKLDLSGSIETGILCLSFLLFLLVRLAFLKGLLLPPYNDSPKHYEIVQSFLLPNTSSIGFYSLSRITVRYYHFGFHILAAWLSTITGMGAADSISLLGQILISIAPLSVLWLIYTITRNVTAGIISSAFTGFAWQMPYYAINWGKYPAVAGLSFLPLIIGIWYLYGREKIRNWPNYLTLVVLTVSLILIHTRLIISLALAASIFFFLTKLYGKQYLNYKIAGLLSLITLIVFGLFWDTLSNYYSNGYLAGLIFGAFLIPFAFDLAPRLSSGISAFALATWITTKINFIFQDHHLVLTDQPFLATMLYIPISSMIGLGFAGLYKKLVRYRVWRWGMGVAVCLILVLGFTSSNVLRPDSCCNYVKQSDLDAFNWIQENTSPDSVFWIAAIHNKDYMIGNDAGIWIKALTGRNSNKLPFDYDWNSETARRSVCRKGYQEVYIYKGGTPYSFSTYALSQQGWLKIAYESTDVAIYEVSCDFM